MEEINRRFVSTPLSVIRPFLPKVRITNFVQHDGNQNPLRRHSVDKPSLSL